jgi:thiol-disulfide isomerase/thioredoxin
MAVQTKKKSPTRIGRTRKIINTIRRGFNVLGKRALNLEVKKEADIPKMDTLLQQPQVTFVLIKASWCGHCKNYEPKWNNYVKTPGRSANMVAMPVELQRNSQVLKSVPLEGVPTVLRVQNGTVTAVDIDEANDPEVMRQEVTRASNIPINEPSLADAIVNRNPDLVEEEDEENEPEPLAPTQEMVELVNKVNTNPRNLGETNGSRNMNQAALNLAVPVAALTALTATETKPINSINLVDLPVANKPIEPAVNMIPAIPEPIPAEPPKPAPTVAAPTAAEPTTAEPAPAAPTTAEPAPAVTETKNAVNLSPPSVVEALFQRNAKKANNVINQAQNEINAAPPATESTLPKQRGGKRTLKKSGKLLRFFKMLTRKLRKI